MTTELDIKKGGQRPGTKDVPVIEFYPEQSKVRVLDVMLDVLPLPNDTMARRFIPPWELMKTAVCWDTPTVLLVRDMAIRLSGRIASRSEGPTGVSKSFTAEVIAAITGRNFLRHNYSKDSDPGDTIGRFIPSDARLAIRFEELLADPNIKSESSILIEKARAENRSLTVYESRRIAALEGISGLEDLSSWRWQNGSLTGSMMYGSVYGADEPNLAPGNVIERENSVTEKRPRLRIVEHEGEVVRELTPEEQAIIDNGGLIDGVISLDQRFWYVAAQNPWGIGGGRVEESEARRNRLQDRIVEALTVREYEEFLMFLIHGNQPDIVWQSRKYTGEKGVQTHYRDLEQIPDADVVFRWLANFQTDLQKLAELGKIGSEKDINGGSYIYTRRNIERFLDSLQAARNTLVDVQELFATGNLMNNSNWHDLFMEALRQEYLVGMYKEDVGIVEKLIQASGIEDRLGPSRNNPALPGWVKRAQERGIQVEMGAGEWILKRTDLTEQQLIDLPEILDDITSEKFHHQIDGDIITALRPLRSILTVIQEDGVKFGVDNIYITAPVGVNNE